MDSCHTTIFGCDRWSAQTLVDRHWPRRVWAAIEPRIHDEDDGDDDDFFDGDDDDFEDDDFEDDFEDDDDFDEDFEDEDIDLDDD